MFAMLSQPQEANGITWSTCQPGQGDIGSLVDGQGCISMKSALTRELRTIAPLAYLTGGPQYRRSSSGAEWEGQDQEKKHAIHANNMKGMVMSLRIDRRLECITSVEPAIQELA